MKKDKCPKGFVKMLKETKHSPAMYSKIDDLDKVDNNYIDSLIDGDDLDVSDIMVNIGTFVEEDDWEEVLGMLLDISQKSFIKGSRIGIKLKDIINSNENDNESK